jgi:NAD(P)-dependent dehydrogenase (short-subunit alcohol dehydrogenase family)
MKKILVTGASRGIGLELTKQYLELGCSVIATCRSPQKANALMVLKKENPQKIDILSMDVEEEQSVESCFNSLLQKKIHIDLVYNNAGIIDWNNLNEVSASSTEKIYKVNLIGALLVTRHALPCLKNSADPIIVNLSSRLGSIKIRGETQLGGAIAYQCSKAALNMLTKQSAIDLQKHNIRVISQSPGWVKTEMGGKDAKYEIKDAVTKMIQSLLKMKSNQTGIFIGEDGDLIPW